MSKKKRFNNQTQKKEKITSAPSYDAPKEPFMTPEKREQIFNIVVMAAILSVASYMFL